MNREIIELSFQTCNVYSMTCTIEEDPEFPDAVSGDNRYCGEESRR